MLEWKEKQHKLWTTKLNDFSYEYIRISSTEISTSCSIFYENI